ncbi:MAG: VIT domain-containing protein [Pseudomonadota bacterium]
MLRTRPRKIPRDLLLDPPPPRTRWLWVLLVGSMFCLLLMASVAMAAPDSFYTSAKGERVDAAPLSTHYEIDIHGIVATTEVTQVFRNDEDAWLDLNYRLPLPDGAAVNHMVMKIGDRVITAVMQRREHAKATFTVARAEGRSVALVEQQRANLFSQSVANVAPGSDIVVTLRFLQTIRMQEGQFALRLPTTLTPRYGHGSAEVSGFSVGSPHTTSLEASININLDAGIGLAELHSPTHELGTERVGDQWRIELRSGTRAQIPMDRDVVLHWRPAFGATPVVAVFRETVGRFHHLLLLVFPPEREDHHLLARELMYIVDTSGSMKGESIRQAKRAVVEAIGTIRPQDRFNIIAFSDRHRMLFPAFVYPAADTVQHAEHFVKGLVAGGGTEMQTHS